MGEEIWKRASGHRALQGNGRVVENSADVSQAGDWVVETRYSEFTTVCSGCDLYRINVELIEWNSVSYYYENLC